MSTQLDLRQSVLRVALPMAGSAVNATTDTILPVFDAEIQKLFQDRNVILMDGGLITFTGTAASFTENLNIVLEQLTNTAGVPVTISLGSTTQPFALSGDILYAVINRSAGTGTLAIASPLNGTPTYVPAVLAANQEVFVIAVRKDALDGTQRLYFRTGSAFNAGQTSRLGSAGSGSGTGSGVGDDLDALTFRASFNDTFTENSANANSSINATGTNAVFSPAKSMYACSYDASKTVTSSTTTATMSAAPSYTVAIGDILTSGLYQRKITAVASQTSYTLEAAFPAALSSAACCVSQAVYTKDVYNFAADGAALSAEFGTATFSEILVDYKDNNVAASNLFTPSVGPFIAFVASNDNSNFTNVAARPTLGTTQIQSVILPSAGTSLYLRFFANQTSGSGTINLISYRSFMQKAAVLTQGGVLWSAYAFTNGVGTPINCTLSVVGSKTTITLTNGNQYAVGVNAGQVYGSIDAYINGQLIPRYVNTTLTPDASYTETSGTVITLDKDYSSINISVEIIQRTQIVDTSTTNTTAIAAIQAQLATSGAGGGFGKNYLTAYTASTGGGAVNSGNGDFELNTTTGWSLFNTTITNLIPTGSIVASAASISTFGTTNTNPIGKKYSLQTTASSAWAAGQGFISDAFYIDREDQAKVLAVTAFYTVSSGTVNLSGTSANTLQVYLFDVANSAWIQPAGAYSMVQGSGVGKISATFQTTFAGTQYRVAIVCINASSGAITLLWDDFSVSPQFAVSAPAMSDMVPYTATFTGMGSPSVSSVFSRRIGDSLEIEGYVTVGTTTGTPGLISIGYNGVNGGVTIDTTKMITGSLTLVGQAALSVANAASFDIAVLSSAPGVLQLCSQSSGSAGLGGILMNAVLSSGQSFAFKAKVPIAGWSSNSVASSDTDTRVCALMVNGLPPTATSGNPIIFPTVTRDTHGAYNATTGQYTASVTGFYSLSGNFGVNTFAASSNVLVWVAGVSVTTLAWEYSANANFSGTAPLVYVLAGQTIDVRPSGGTLAFAGTNTQFSIMRVTGPAVITATESVNASYYLSTTYTPGTNVQINYDTKLFDSHNAVTTGVGAWKFTAPVSGVYNVTQQFDSVTAGYILLYKNGSPYTYLSVSGNGAGQVPLGTGSVLVKLLAGEYVDIRTSTTQSIAGSAAPYQVMISIHRTGN